MMFFLICWKAWHYILHIPYIEYLQITIIDENCFNTKYVFNFPFLDGDVPQSTSYGVYISQPIRFARASSYVADVNTRNKLFTQKLLKQGYRYHKLCKTFSKFIDDTMI